MDKTSDVATHVARLIAPFLARHDLDLWGVEHFQGKGRGLLRVYIEAPDGVDVEACALVSRQLGTVLDVEDIMPTAYTLEVSSPGLERTFFTLTQMAPYLGRTVDIALAPEVSGRRRFRGALTAVTPGGIELSVDETAQTFDWSLVAKARLVHDFSTPGSRREKDAGKSPKPRRGGKK